jgi:hypothetical protein
MAAVDAGYLAAHLGLPEDQIGAVVTAPTVDLVSVVLAAVAAKGLEYNALFSQKLQLEVELETSVRAAEAQRDVSNGTAKKALKEVEGLRQALQAEGIAPPFFCRLPLTAGWIQRPSGVSWRTSCTRSSRPAPRHTPRSTHCALALPPSRRPAVIP